MGKLGCTCGNVISNTTDMLSYRGYVLKDQDFYAVFDTLCIESESLIEAASSGKLKSWMQRHSISDLPGRKPRDMLSSVLFNLISDTMIVMYECEECGRLLVQSQSESNYASYSPDTRRYEAILQSIQPPRSDVETSMYDAEKRR